MAKLLIATRNPGKFLEFTACFAPLGFELVSLNDVGLAVDAPEDEPTFEANALQKARFYHKLSGLPTLADDGGLEIDALGGAPGVKSRRWVGHRMEDEELLAYAVSQVALLAPNDRGCQFRTCVAFVWDGGERVEEERLRGECRVPPHPSREAGYPFRSPVYLPSMNKFFIELTESEHAEVNHRRKAALRLRDFIATLDL